MLIFVVGFNKDSEGWSKVENQDDYFGKPNYDVGKVFGNESEKSAKKKMIPKCTCKSIF